MKTENLKSRIFKLLKEDEEFRYAVAGLIGFDEILKRLDRNEAELVRLREDFNKLREDMNEGFKRSDEMFEKHWREIQRLREDMNKGFERSDKMFEKHWREIQKLREDMNQGFKRSDEMFEKHWREIQRLREDMNEGFKRSDEMFEKHWREIQRLREDMNKGFESIHRMITALGSRWGVFSEEAFREGLKGLLKDELKLKVDRWKTYDERGKVYGYPSEVEIDIAMSDGEVVLIEISSHVRASDIYQFKRKAELYEEKTGRRPDKLMIITPFAEEKAVEAAKKLGIIINTKI